MLVFVRHNDIRTYFFLHNGLAFYSVKISTAKTDLSYIYVMYHLLVEML